MVIVGLKQARFGFTDMMKAAKNGESVVIIEKGQSRSLCIGYKVVRMTDEETKAAMAADPVLSMPQPGLPLPTII